MIRQRRAKPLNSTPPYLYTQKLSKFCFVFYIVSDGWKQILFSLPPLNYYFTFENNVAIFLIGPAPVSLPQTSSSITGIQNGAINQRSEFNEDEFNDSAIEYRIRIFLVNF